MALLHLATLAPTKLELLTGWLPGRAWVSGPVQLRQLGSYRFDDPAGEVGIEGLIVQTEDGAVLHVPLTYRGAPLPGAEEYLVGTIEHSVLGRRWVYDACGDPVWATATANAVLAGGAQAEEFVGDSPQPRQPTVTISSSAATRAPITQIDTVTAADEGPTTLVRAGGVELIVVRVIGSPTPAASELLGRWAETEPAVLVAVRPS